MAPLTKDTTLRFKGEVKTEKFICDTSTGWTCYKGGGIIIDADVSGVHVRTAEGCTMQTGDVFIGIAAEGKTVVAGAREDTEIEVMVWPTIVGFKNAVLTNTSLGKVVSMSDTATLSVAAAGAYPRIGKLFKVEDGYAYVQLDSPFVQTV